MLTFNLNLTRFLEQCWKSFLKVLNAILITLIKAYKYILSPLLGSHCRYYPTCSTYAEQAISRHGAFQGSWLALKRIFSCHPWGSSGYDPVPPKNKTGKSLFKN